MDLLERAKILLKATKDLLEKQEDSCYVLNLLTETVFYDGVDCDGNCLKDDIGYWFDELEDAQNVSQKWIPCSEELPKIKNQTKRYLVTLKNGTVCDAMFTECDGEQWWNYNYDDVIAWQELPKGYKAETKE